MSSNRIGVTGVLTLCLAGAATAQTGFSGREAFFAADSAVVRASLGAIPLGDSAALDKIVRDDIPTLSDFFNVRPSVFWADGQGSSSHPSAGIGLDRLRLSSMRADLGASEFGDVVFFILAHEFAHMAQFGHYPVAMLSDTRNRKLVECQADLWAGALMEILLVDSVFAKVRQPPDREKIAALVQQDFIRIEQALSLAYQIGSPRWDSLAGHPTPGLRGLCVAHGIRAGIQMGRFRDYQKKPTPDLLAQIRNYEAADSAVLRFGMDPWKWSDVQAGRIVKREGIPKIDLITPLKALFASAEIGPQRFYETALRGLPSMSCNSTDGATAVEMICEDSVFSVAMQRDTYNNLRIMVLASLRSTVWSELPEQTGNGNSVRSSFEFAKGRASITIFYPQSDGRYKHIYLRMTSTK